MDLLRNIFKGDKVVWIIFLCLCLISVVEVFSASSTLIYTSGNHWAPITRHASFLVGGVVIVIFFHYIPYRWFQVFPRVLLPVAGVFLVLLLAFDNLHLGGILVIEKTNEAGRWVKFLGLPFQPSEFAKMGVIIATAYYLSRGQTDEGASPKAFKQILKVAGITCLLILPENYSTGAMLFGVVFLMMIVGRIQTRKLLKLGGSLLAQIAAQRETLMRERGLKLNLVGVSGRSKAAFSHEGIDPARYREAMGGGGPGGVEHMVREILDMNVFNSVFVDCTASEEVAAQYLRLLRGNVSVVTANKIAASSAYDNYALLKRTARERGVKFLFETNVGAGLPIINTINDLRGSGDRILCIEAVLSGTLNYVFNTLSADVTLSRAVRLAQENGYSEPDPRVDLSGKDVVRKLTILARESGYRMEAADVERHLFIPEELFSGTLDEFWERLPGLDARFEQERRRLAAERKHWRFVASWKDGRGEVGLREIPQNHPFYTLEGSNNIILITTERYKEYPMLIQGYGAGADVTAAGVFADIMSVANI